MPCIRKEIALLLDPNLNFTKGTCENTETAKARASVHMHLSSGSGRKFQPQACASWGPPTRVLRAKVTWGIRKYRSRRKAAAHQRACLSGLVIAEWLACRTTDHPSPLFRSVMLLITIARRIAGGHSQGQPNTYLLGALAAPGTVCASPSRFRTSLAHNQDHTFPSGTLSCPPQAHHPLRCGSVSSQCYFY